MSIKSTKKNVKWSVYLIFLPHNPKVYGIHYLVEILLPYTTGISNSRFR